MHTRAHTGIFLMAAVVAGCGTAEIASRWRSSDVPAPAFNEKSMTGTVCNDSEYLYIGVRTTSPGMQRLLEREGVTWWFDAQGGSKKTFGIHYPIRLQGERPKGGDEGDDAPPGFGDRQTPRKPPTDLDLFFGEKEHQRMSLLATGGIEAGFHRERDTLVYEIRIPLNPGATHPFGIGARGGTVIGLGAETSDYKSPTDLPIERPEGEGEPEGGFGGRRSGGARRGGPRPDSGPHGEQLNLWMKVRLATGESPLKTSP
jgi:hypothetical protein